MRAALTGLATILALACHRDSQPSWLEAPYAEPATSGTRVMLVAGGNDVANFAQEVVDQRRMWRGTAIADEQIACFWAKPTGAALEGDRKQYDRVARDIGGCAAASPASVLDAIAAAAASRPTDFYLFITSHGVAELGGEAHGWALPPEERTFLGQPALALDADAPGHTPTARVGNTEALLEAWRNQPTARGRIAVTPAALRDALLAFDEDVRRVVVLQGCFSGGFVQGPDSLRAVPNTVVLTAAAADRPSFGCGSGTRTTFWGGALLHELEPRLGQRSTPTTVDWSEVHRGVARRVRHLERALGQRPSRPQFVDTARVNVER